MPAPSQEVSETALHRATELADGLYPHQVEGVAFLLARRRSILADDMGLGKTRQSIIAMYEAEPDGPWLIVCPASVKQNWAREILLALSQTQEITVVDKKTPVPSPGYRAWVVVNYDIVKKNRSALQALNFAGFVFDEAHYLKNHQAQRSKAARSLLDEAVSPMVHCLTGTPMMNRPRDLFPLLQLVNHALGRSFLGFAKRYCDAKKGEFGWETKGASNLDELAVQLHGTMLRRTKDEVLDLPNKVRTWLTVDIPATTRNRGMRRVLATLLKETSADHDPPREITSTDMSASGDHQASRLPPISRAKLLARLMAVRGSVAGAKMKHTLEFARGILDQGEKLIIYTCFQEVAETLADEFDAGMVRMITGSTPVDDRQTAVDDFQNDDNVRVLCATVIAGGVGITLTAARAVIFNDLDWVPANHWQAEDRAHRIGQTHAVNVYYFKAANSIDEFVGQVLETKSKLINTVVEGGALSDSDSTGDVLSELERIVRHLNLDHNEKIAEHDIETAMDRAVAVYADEHRQIVDDKDPLHQPSPAKTETIRALARALSPPDTAKRYRTISSKPGQYYDLEVDGTDVICSCRGFEFRGQC